MHKLSHVIDIQSEDPLGASLDLDQVEERLYTLLDSLDVKEPVEFSVTFVDDEKIKELNKQYREKDEATDILSFVQQDGDDPWPKEADEPKVLGDMVISLSSMRRNAEQFGVSEDEELHRLLVHGVLHLLGGDHKTNDVALEPMLQQQEALLKRLREQEN